FRPQLAGLCKYFRPALRIKYDLCLAVPITEIDEHNAALIAVRIDPAAKRHLVANMFRPQLPATMSPNQDNNSEVKLWETGICARNQPSRRRRPALYQTAASRKGSIRTLREAIWHVRLLPGAHAAIDQQHLPLHVPRIIATQINGPTAADIAERH